MDMEKLASIFEAVKILPLRPTDQLIFRCKQKLSEEMYRRVNEEIKRLLPGVKVLLLNSGFDVEVLRVEP